VSSYNETFRGCLGLAGGDIALHLFVLENLP
jgi:hypothetical protein